MCQRPIHEPVRQRRGVLGRSVFSPQSSFLFCLLMRDLWMCGITPPPAMVACKHTHGTNREGDGGCTGQGPTSAAVMLQPSQLTRQYLGRGASARGMEIRALIRVSSSSSPRMASCK